MLMACNSAAASKLTLSDEFDVCISGVESVEVVRNIVIDVEKASVSVQQHQIAEFVFDELGIGAYNQLVEDGRVKGASFNTQSGITVYAQLFQGQSLVFIARAIKPKPVWIYATFPNVKRTANVSQAIQVMRSLGTCNPS